MVPYTLLDNLHWYNLPLAPCPVFLRNLTHLEIYQESQMALDFFLSVFICAVSRYRLELAFPCEIPLYLGFGHANIFAVSFLHTFPQQLSILLCPIVRACLYDKNVFDPSNFVFAKHAVLESKT